MGSDSDTPSTSEETAAKAFVWAFNVSGGALGGSQVGLGFGIPLRLHGAASLDLYNQTAADTDRVVAVIDPDQVESLGNHFREILGRKVESIPPVDFLDGAEEFLNSLRLDGQTEIEVDYSSIADKDGHALRLTTAVGACKDYLNARRSSIKLIEIESHGSDAQFNIWLSLRYLRWHRQTQPGIAIYINLLFHELGPEANESFERYRQRMKSLDSSIAESNALYSKIESRKKDFYANVLLQARKAFPKLRTEIFERG